MKTFLKRQCLQLYLCCLYIVNPKKCRKRHLKTEDYRDKWVALMDVKRFMIHLI